VTVLNQAAHCGESRFSSLLALLGAQAAYQARFRENPLAARGMMLGAHARGALGL